MREIKRKGTGKGRGIENGRGKDSGPMGVGGNLGPESLPLRAAYSRIPPLSALHKIFMNLFSPPLAVALSTLSSRVVWLPKEAKACQQFNFYLNFDFFVSPTSA